MSRRATVGGKKRPPAYNRNSSNYFTDETEQQTLLQSSNESNNSSRTDSQATLSSSEQHGTTTSDFRQDSHELLSSSENAQRRRFLRAQSSSSTLLVSDNSGSVRSHVPNHSSVTVDISNDSPTAISTADDKTDEDKQKIKHKRFDEDYYEPFVGGKASRFCDRYYNACMARCYRLCPFAYRILRSPPEHYRTTKLAVGMPIGFAMGLIYYHIIIDRMRLGEYMRYMLGSMMTIGMAFGYGTSVRVRALTWLVIPNMFGRGGRTVLLTCAVAALINGPIAHIVANLKESIRSVTCSAEVTMELAKKRFELMSKPIHEVLKDFAAQSLKLHNISDRIHQAFAPMEMEVAGQRETQQLEQKFKRMDSEIGIDRSKTIEDKTKVDQPDSPPPSAVGGDAKTKVSPKSRGAFLQMMYQRKLDFRCGDIFNHAVDACKAELGRAYRDCMSHLSIIGYLFCWPCKLGVLCNAIKILPNPIDCDAARVMQTDFGDAFAEAERADAMLEDAFEVRVEYKIERRRPQPIVDQRTPKESIRSMNAEFEEKEEKFNFWTTLFQRVLAFLFIRVFIVSSGYLKAYTLDIRHDNCYMTTYFRKIEQRRLLAGRSTLLPLKRAERREIIEPLSLKLLPSERKKIVSGSVFIVVQSVSCLIVFAFDRLMYDMLDLIARHTRVEFHQRGRHHISLNVTGEGAVAQMVRTIFVGFSKTHTIDQRINNDRCLPYPIRSGFWWYLKVYGSLVAMWLLMCSEAYGMRLRHVIAAFFFRRRSKARTLHLYNGMITRRKTYVMHLRHQVRRQARRRDAMLQRATSVWQSLYALYPRMLFFVGWWCGAARGQCFACKTTLGKKGFRNLLNDDSDSDDDDGGHKCDATAGCPAVYCAECWQGLEEHCYCCQPQKSKQQSETQGKENVDDAGSDEGFESSDDNLAPSGDSEGDEAD